MQDDLYFQRKKILKKIDDWILIINSKDVRQDLQDYLDIQETRFPEETGNMQSASWKMRLLYLNI